jgi:hypothetical protein
MKVIGIFILSLLLTLSTLNATQNAVSEIDKTSQVFIVDFEESHSSSDIEVEDEKMHFSFLYIPYSILTDSVVNEKKTHFHYATYSLLEPPKPLFA